jgi:hypothetical protein
MKSQLGQMLIGVVGMLPKLQDYCLRALANVCPTTTQQEAGLFMQTALLVGKHRGMALKDLIEDLARAHWLFSKEDFKLLDIGDNSVMSQVRAAPLIMPENKMSMGTMPRGSVTILCNMPKGSFQALRDNWLEYYGLAMLAGEYGKDDMEKMESISTDAYAIESLDMLTLGTAKDTTANYYIMTMDTLRRLHKLAKKNSSVVIAFANELKKVDIDRIKSDEETVSRVITWNEDYGDPVFYGKEVAMKKLQDMLKSMGLDKPDVPAEEAPSTVEEPICEGQDTDAGAPKPTLKLITE